MFNAIVTDVRQQRRHGTSHFPEWGVSRNLVESSVTRLGDILDFGQLFKAFGDN